MGPKVSVAEGKVVLGKVSTSAATLHNANDRGRGTITIGHGCMSPLWDLDTDWVSRDELGDELGDVSGTRT